jgi:mono/diheme cytochrome c family protein
MRAAKNLFPALFFTGSIILAIFSTPSCQSNDEVQFKKSMSIGKQTYQKRCQHCHGENGKGMGRLFPPIDSADYLLANKYRLACIIQYGQAGEIIVNGVTYNQVMPANPDLLPDEIAHLMTYILNAWSNDEGFVDKEYVKRSLDQCDDQVKN